MEHTDARFANQQLMHLCPPSIRSNSRYFQNCMYQSILSFQDFTDRGTPQFCLQYKAPDLRRRIPLLLIARQLLTFNKKCRPLTESCIPDNRRYSICFLNQLQRKIKQLFDQLQRKIKQLFDLLEVCVLGGT